MKMRNNTSKIIASIAFLIFIVITVFIYIETVKLKPELYLRILFLILVVSGTVLFFINMVKKETTENTKINKEIKQMTEAENQDLIKKDEELKLIEEQKKYKIDKVSDGILSKLELAKDKEEFSIKLLRNLANEFAIVQGVVFMIDINTKKFDVQATYAIYTNEEIRSFVEGEGINGQVAKNKEILHVKNIPQNYITVLSGLGEGSPNEMLIFPIIFQEQTIGIVEVASFIEFPEITKEVYLKISESLSDIVHSLLN